MSDIFSGSGGCSSVTILNKAAAVGILKYGGDPVSSSITVQPTLLKNTAVAGMERWSVTLAQAWLEGLRYMERGNDKLAITSF